ncbi:Sec-independent protein translocase subunit TatA [Hoyosella rhizosphaerae]|uniref:Sec-independent protein translocase protein TatA n=1 Tax=Hoyosella rhizosphaerae TaxID=1755582 RepID=A0A916U0Z0_9ACTN|nr:Sec-independent protein translocase subunit TatA [Hoyosella rhizosphaerae]MBN4927078.1 Sec-independent protein translocase subunit TatA [Hoyosella rhizosphaerae]GGC54231.1 hypothetical protein GCM10011410_03220 [Hoyosella rhizosphaerae]
MGFTSPWHWLILLLVIVVLFGSKRLPDAARGLGRSMRIFKSEIKEMGNDGDESPKRESTPPQQLAAPPLSTPAPEAQPGTGQPQAQGQGDTQSGQS